MVTATRDPGQLSVVTRHPSSLGPLAVMSGSVGTQSEVRLQTIDNYL